MYPELQRSSGLSLIWGKVREARDWGGLLEVGRLMERLVLALTATACCSINELKTPQLGHLPNHWLDSPPHSLQT
jgi:hypothetical protein